MKDLNGVTEGETAILHCSPIGEKSNGVLTNGLSKCSSGSSDEINMVLRLPVDDDEFNGIETRVSSSQQTDALFQPLEPPDTSPMVSSDNHTDETKEADEITDIPSVLDRVGKSVLGEESQSNAPSESEHSAVRETVSVNGLVSKEINEDSKPTSNGNVLNPGALTNGSTSDDEPNTVLAVEKPESNGPCENSVDTDTIQNSSSSSESQGTLDSVMSLDTNPEHCAGSQSVISENNESKDEPLESETEIKVDKTPLPDSSPDEDKVGCVESSENSKVVKETISDIQTDAEPEGKVPSPAHEGCVVETDKVQESAPNNDTSNSSISPMEVDISSLSDDGVILIDDNEDDSPPIQNGVAASVTSSDGNNSSPLHSNTAEESHSLLAGPFKRANTSEQSSEENATRKKLKVMNITEHVVNGNDTGVESNSSKVREPARQSWEDSTLIVDSDEEDDSNSRNVIKKMEVDNSCGSMSSLPTQCDIKPDNKKRVSEKITQGVENGRRENEIKKKFYENNVMFTQKELKELEGRPKAMRVASTLRRVEQMVAQGMSILEISKLSFIQEDEVLLQLSKNISTNIRNVDIKVDTEGREFTPKSFRNFVSQKIAEILLCNSDLGQTKLKYQSVDEEFKNIIVQYNALKKQYQNLIHVLKKLMDERRVLNSKDEKAKVQPQRITRSVGLQVCTVGSMFVRTKAISMAPSNAPSSRDRAVNPDKEPAAQASPKPSANSVGLSSPPSKPVQAIKAKPLGRQAPSTTVVSSLPAKSTKDVVVVKSPSNAFLFSKVDNKPNPVVTNSSPKTHLIHMAKKSSSSPIARLNPSSCVQTVYNTPSSTRFIAKKGTTHAPAYVRSNLASPTKLPPTLANRPAISVTSSPSSSPSSSSSPGAPEIIDLTDKDDEITSPSSPVHTQPNQINRNIVVIAKSPPRPIAIPKPAPNRNPAGAGPLSKPPFRSKIQLGNTPDVSGGVLPIALVAYTVPSNVDKQTTKPQHQILQLRSETKEGQITINGITPDCINLPKDEVVPGRSISSLLTRFPKGSHPFAFDPIKLEVVVLSDDVSVTDYHYYYQHLPVLPQPKGELITLPPEPLLKVCRNPLGPGIMLSWNYTTPPQCKNEIINYQLYACNEDVNEGSSRPADSWSKVGDVSALPLPMACTLVQFTSGLKYFFAVRGQDSMGRLGPFSTPASILLVSPDSKITPLPRGS